MSYNKLISILIHKNIFIYVLFNLSSTICIVKDILKLGIEFSFFFCRFTDDAFDAEQAATIGVDFKVKTITINGDKVSGYKFSKFCPCFINIMKNNCVHRIN